MHPGVPRQQHSQRVVVMFQSLYNLGLCVLLLVVLFAQLFGAIWSSTTVVIPVRAGRSPALGLYTIPGFNDEPYSDRAVVCVKQGRYFRPIQLSTLLKRADTRDTSQLSTNGIDGYRVVSRNTLSMDASGVSYYVQQCNGILKTLESIFYACEKLGYNVTQDVLRVVDGVDTKEVTILPDTLPVLILPYLDLGDSMRYAVPGHDGSSCVFRADGIFTSDSVTNVAWLKGVNRTIREARTVEWLRYPGGIWRNGWYEDPVVLMRWYSDVISSIPHGSYGTLLRQFDLINNATEVDCSITGCRGGAFSSRWDDEVVLESSLDYFDSVAISNGSRFGFFQFDAQFTQTIVSRYNIGKLLSNVCFVALLARWTTAIRALYPLDSIGIGSLSNLDTFHYLPLLLLPRLKSSLLGFWTGGCRFEGPQLAFESAWFEIYPAIGEVVVLLFSLLNLLAKIMRRRMSDLLFGPTLLFFCVLHYFRYEIVKIPFLGIDGRMPSVVTSSELEAASIFDLVFTNLAFRVNGKLTALFTLKVAVLLLNFLPLFLRSRGAAYDVLRRNDLPVERALGVHFGSNGGLGCIRSAYNPGITAVRPYEVVRLGYIVVGSMQPGYRTVGLSQQFLVSVEHWFWLLLGAVSRCLTPQAFRIAVYELDGAESLAKTVPESNLPSETSSLRLVLADITNKRFNSVAIMKIGSRPLR